jgi:hypothetical protein
MAAVPKFSDACVNAEADAIGGALNTGYIRLYNGSQPANADTAVGAQTLLAELRFGADAFPAASAGLLTANSITADPSANATGTASWARILASDGTTVYFDGSVGTADANVIIATTSIVAAPEITCSALTLQVSKV